MHLTGEIHSIHRPSRRHILAALASLFLKPPAFAGTQDPTFSAGVKVVNVLATVKNKRREIIRDLTQPDFFLAEDGRPQSIRYFARQSDLPLTLGLMIDTSPSQERVLDEERAASFRFVDQVLRLKKDQVFVIQFDSSVQVRQELTSSWKQLNEALTAVEGPSHKEMSNGIGVSTHLYDAVLTASKDILQHQQGRKALILLTDGVDFGSEANAAAAIDAAQRGDTLIYSILFSDPHAYSLGGPDGRSVLTRFSKDTGGGFFEVSKKKSIDQIFAIIEDELRSQYSLGYVSDQPVRLSEFRKIQLTTTQKGLTVQARDRYWAQP